MIKGWKEKVSAQKCSLEGDRKEMVSAQECSTSTNTLGQEMWGTAMLKATGKPVRLE